MQAGQDYVKMLLVLCVTVSCVSTVFI